MSPTLAGALAIVGATASLSLLGCPTGRNDPTPDLDGGWGPPVEAGPRDVMVEERSDADPGAVPWDPVWHQTAPADFPVLQPDGLSCGPGCRFALNADIRTRGTDSHAFTTERIAALARFDVDGVAVGYPVFAAIGESTTHVVPNAGIASVLGSYLTGDLLSSVHVQSLLDSDIYVTNIVTGESKLVYRFHREQSPLPTVDLTAVNSKYVFWTVAGPLFSRNLQTGEIRELAWVGTCHHLCASETTVICGSVDAGRVYAVDVETGERTRLWDSPGMQVEATCSPDRTQVVWVDYRDPPGLDATYWYHRTGGEIYMKNLATGDQRRITFDSPASPRGKTSPGIDGDLIVWKEPGSDRDPNPLTIDELVYANALGVYDMKTGKRCRIEQQPLAGADEFSVHGRHVYGYWLEPTTQTTRLIDVDLDDPAIECKPN